MPWNNLDEKRDDGDDMEDGDEEVDENEYKSQKDAVIFLIDVSPSMLRQPPETGDRKADRDSPVTAALKCASRIMQQRIISQPKDMMGILLFGTEKSKYRIKTEDESAPTPGAYPHCYLLTDLNVPSAQDVLRLKNLADEGEDPEGILKASDERPSFSNVLFSVNQLFTLDTPNFGSRRLFIITDNDSPQPEDGKKTGASAQRAKDLYDIGATIELFPIQRDGKEFDLTKFFDDIIYQNPAEVAFDQVSKSKSGDGLTLLGSLIKNVTSKQVPKRAYFSNLPFEIAPGLTISVKGYLPLHRQVPARTSYVYLGGNELQVAKAESTRVDDESKKSVGKTEIKKAYKFGVGSFVQMRPDEASDLRRFGEPVLRVIGFKPRSMLPKWASVTKSTFIFPSEDGFVGSSRVFSALWQKLLKHQKMGIAWCISRKNGAPTLVAILSSASPDREDCTTPYLPAGLWLYRLPFLDDVRRVDHLQPTARCPDSLIEKMRPIIKNLNIPGGFYRPERYPNPSLQWHYKVLQTLALEEDISAAGPADDSTIPKFKQIEKRVGGYMDEWKEELRQHASNLKTRRAIKREAVEDREDERPAKRARAKKTAGPLTDAQLKVVFCSSAIGAMHVPELKEILTTRGLSTSGRKGQLVERLEQWIRENLA